MDLPSEPKIRQRPSALDTQRPAAPAGEEWGLPASTSKRAELDRRRRLATVVELLSEDSPSVLAVVRRELESSGKAAFPALERAARAEDARLRSRARDLLAFLRRKQVYRRLLRAAARPELDLESGLFLLASLDRPRFDARPYRRALDAMANEVGKRARSDSENFAHPMALAHYLGNELGFVGGEEDFSHPDHIHLHRAIELKRGMPLTLTAIYLFVARRTGLKAAPLALPGRVMLRLYLGRRSMIVDPFQGGRARTRTDCLQYLASHGLVPRPEWFRNATDAQLFQRHLMNLASSFQMRGLERDARELHAIARVMHRVHAQALEGTPT